MTKEIKKIIFEIERKKGGSKSEFMNCKKIKFLDATSTAVPNFFYPSSQKSKNLISLKY